MRSSNRARAQRLQFCLTRAPHVWINLDTDGPDDVRLAPDQSELRTKAQRRLSKLETATLRWFECVNQGRRTLCVDIDSTFPDTVELHLRRILVFHRQRNGS